MTNPTPHRATPEQWAFVADDAIGDCDLHSLCLLELRDSLAAAEQRISELEGKQDTQRIALLSIYERLDRLKDRHESNWRRIVKLEEGTSYCALAEATAAAPPPPVTRRPLREPSAATIAECGGPCEQGFWHCDCGLLEKMNPDLSPAKAAPAGSLVGMAERAIWSGEQAPDARAAILACADWLESQNVGAARAAARWLREEVERHG